MTQVEERIENIKQLAEQMAAEAREIPGVTLISTNVFPNQVEIMLQFNTIAQLKAAVPQATDHSYGRGRVGAEATVAEVFCYANQVSKEVGVPA